MAATRKHESDAYMHATATAREMRGVVGLALAAMVAETDLAGSRGEMVARLEEMLQIERRMNEARGRYEQAIELDLPLSPSLRALRDQQELLRGAVMNIAAACGRWAAAMDFELVRARDPRLNGLGASNHGRRQSEEA